MSKLERFIYYLLRNKLPAIDIEETISRVDDDVSFDANLMAYSIDKASLLTDIIITPPEPEPIPPPEPEPPPPYQKSLDTITIYVSSSDGNDTNDGLTPSTAKKTIFAGIAALRSGYPDWLLIKRGDVFYEAIGAWKKLGRSKSEPMVVWTYGDSAARPKLLTGSSDCIKCDGGGNTPAFIHSVVFCGLHFAAHTRIPNSADFVSTNGGNGIYWLRHSKDIIFDDLYIEYYTNGLVVQDYDTTGVDGITIKNCVIVDSYNVGGRSQGIFISGVTNLVIEDNVLDKNGWNEFIAGAEATIYNHNAYLQWNNGLDVVFRRNIVTRASSHGIQLRSGGIIENNFFHKNPIEIFAGYDTPVVGATAAIIANVILEGCDITPSLPRGWGITLKNLTSAVVDGNIVAHVKTPSTNRRSVEIFPFCTYLNNIVHDWEPGKTSVGWGETLNTPGPWKDSNRTVTTYCASLGLMESDFYSGIRSLSRTNPNNTFSLDRVSSYIRDGFIAP